MIIFPISVITNNCELSKASSMFLLSLLAGANISFPIRFSFFFFKRAMKRLVSQLCQTADHSFINIHRGSALFIAFNTHPMQNIQKFLIFESTFSRFALLSPALSFSAPMFFIISCSFRISMIASMLFLSRIPFAPL